MVIGRLEPEKADVMHVTTPDVDHNKYYTEIIYCCDISVSLGVIIQVFVYVGRENLSQQTVDFETTLA